MTRKSKTPARKDTPDTEGAENSLMGVLPDQDDAPEQTAAEDDTSAAPQDADPAETGIEDVSPEPLAAAEAEETGAETPEAEAPVDAGNVSVAPEDAETTDPEAPELVLPEAVAGDPLPVATVTVVCHRDGGRRRAGRRWPQGETTVPASDLLPYELAMLQGDPQFTVRVG